MRRVRLGTILTTFVLVTSVPLAALAGWLTWTSGTQQQQLIHAQNIEKVRAVSAAIDLEVERTMGALVALSTLDPIDQADLRHFVTIAARLLPIHPSWQAVRLIDPQVRVIASTLPDDAVSGDTEWIHRIVQTRRGAVSTVRRSPAGAWVVNIGVPVVRGGTVQYVLASRVAAQALTDSLRRQQAPEGGVLTLLDVEQTIVARTRNAELYVGGKPTADFIDRARNAPAGSWRTVLLEGVPAYSAWFRSPVTGWTVGLGMPSEAVDRALRGRTAAIIAAGIGTLGVGLSIALVLGRRIVRAETGAAEAAKALARGEPVPVVRSTIVELDELGIALREAAGILEQRLRERDAAAEALSRAKDNFIATVSHELRTPLNAIYGWVAMLRTGSLDPARQQHALEVIERNARAQSQVVEDLLDMSSIIHGRLRLEAEPVDLAAVVRSAVEVSAPTADRRRATITVRDPGEPVVVAGDPARLQQIVWNLIANALKFTPADGSVDVGVSIAGENAVVTVKDNGEGIGAEFLPHVFDRFRQESDQVTRQHSGLGIGLALARTLTELHGGTIEAHSDGKGHGATFIVRFPLHRAGV
ncbi:MAG TPA: sensor histidine kinase [Vicinamibacterales bacterium]|nr:sensor histidine kinase [Vicinamibacterales bacterium]